MLSYSVVAPECFLKQVALAQSADILLDDIPMVVNTLSSASGCEEKNRKVIDVTEPFYQPNNFVVSS